jgi:hypothetical protein
MKTSLVAMFALAVLAGAAGVGFAEEPVKQPSEERRAPEPEPVTDAMPAFDDSEALPEHTYLAEVVDSVFSVGPAEFFALDMPADPVGARAIHLSGTVSVADRKGDIMVRLFTAADYQKWLKKKGGEKGVPFWSSKRSRNIGLDHNLPNGTRVVVLLDNGYSVRTPKRVRTQLQIQYATTGAATAATGGSAPAAQSQPADDLIIPRANTEDEIPPPPPPPDENGQQQQQQ